MLLRGILLRALLVALLQLALLLPAGLTWADSAQVCGCGMKKGSCFCDLAAQGKSGKHPCTSSKVCPLTGHGDSPGNSSPRISLDLRQRMGVLELSSSGFVPAPDRLTFDCARRQPRSLTHPPEAPPPRRSTPAS